MEMTRGTEREKRDAEGEEDAACDGGTEETENESFLPELNLLVVLLSEFSISNGQKEVLERQKEVKKIRKDRGNEILESRVRANTRLTKDTKLMGRRAHVLQPMAKEFRHYRKM